MRNLRQGQEAIVRANVPRVAGVRVRVIARSKRTGMLTCELMEDSVQSRRWTRGSILTVMPYDVDEVDPLPSLLRRQAG